MPTTIEELEVNICYKKIIDGTAILIDVREPDEIKGVAYNVPHRIDIPLSTFTENINRIPKDKDLVIGCRSGIRSYDVVNFLQQNNFKNVYNLKGGILKWTSEHLPINGDIKSALH